VDIVAQCQHVRVARPTLKAFNQEQSLTTTANFPKDFAQRAPPAGAGSFIRVGRANNPLQSNREIAGCGRTLMISVFISYAHRDEKLKKRFLVHLGALKRERLIGVWHDRMLRSVTEKEMQRAFARAKVGRCKVVPVILKPSLWHNIPIDDEGGRLGDFVALPHDGKPVTRSLFCLVPSNWVAKW
jgi:hypothetical protein